MVSLYQEIGTAYVCIWHTSELRRICEEHKGETIDLRGMSFTDDAYRVLLICMGICDFVDTSDKEKDATLRHNSIAIKEAQKNTSTVIEFNCRSIQELVTKWLHSLKIGETYTISLKHSDSLAYAVYDVINLMRPGVKVRPNGSITGYIRHVSGLWVPKTCGWSSYLVVVGEELKFVEPKGGVIEEYGQEIPELEYIIQHDCIPSDFGVKSVKELPEFKPILDKAIQTIEFYLQRKVKLLDWLEVDA